MTDQETTTLATTAHRTDRRSFLRLAATGAAGAFLAGRAAFAADSPAYTQAMAEAQACKNAGNMAGMAAAIKKALKLGEGNEYAWRSLAWALARSGQWEESLQYARENVRRHGQHPWPLAQLADSALCVHDEELTHWALKRASQMPAEAGKDVVPALKDGYGRWLGMFGSRRLSITWTAPMDGLQNPDNLLWVRLPQLHHPRQTVKWEVVSGATEATHVQSEDVDYARVRYGKEPLVVRTEILLRPGTVPIAELRKTNLRNIPPAITKEFLATSTDVPILPEGPVCGELIAKLRGKTPYDTIDSIMRWFRDNFTYRANPTQDSEGLLKEHFGVCHHYSVAISALCRAAGIPARIVGGEVFGWSGPNDRSVVGGGSHGWVEVYLNPLGWVELDGLSYDTFGAIHRSLGNAYVRFHTVGHVGNPILPYEWSMQGFQKIEAQLLEAIPCREF
jgi:transglutaminase-like putative cysteine protease